MENQQEPKQQPELSEVQKSIVELANESAQKSQVKSPFLLHVSKHAYLYSMLIAWVVIILVVGLLVMAGLKII